MNWPLTLRVKTHRSWYKTAYPYISFYIDFFTVFLYLLIGGFFPNKPTISINTQPPTKSTLINTPISSPVCFYLPKISIPLSFHLSSSTWQRGRGYSSSWTDVHSLAYGIFTSAKCHTNLNRVLSWNYCTNIELSSGQFQSIEQSQIEHCIYRSTDLPISDLFFYNNNCSRMPNFNKVDKIWRLKTHPNIKNVLSAQYELIFTAIKTQFYFDSITFPYSSQKKQNSKNNVSTNIYWYLFQELKAQCSFCFTNWIKWTSTLDTKKKKKFQNTRWKKIDDFGLERRIPTKRIRFSWLVVKLSLNLWFPPKVKQRWACSIIND